MSLEVIYLTRHGFRSNWLVDPATGNYKASIPSPTGISADPALTAHGVDQAKELGRHLLTVDPPIEVVYSSPYYRCLQTVTPFVELRAREQKGGQRAQQGQRTVAAAEESGHEAAATDDDHDGDDDAATLIRPETGIAEWYGSAPFEHPTPASAQVLKGMFPRYDERYRAAVVPAARGETVHELYERLAAAVGAIIDQADAEGRRAVLLCSHAAPIIALARVLTGSVPDKVESEDFAAFTCGLSVYRRRRTATATQDSKGEEYGIPANEAEKTHDSWRDGRGVRGGWACEVDSDCSFLSGGEERGWRFSGDESFHKVDDASNQPDAGIALGVVVQGRTKKTTEDGNQQQEHQPSSSRGDHHL